MILITGFSLKTCVEMALEDISMSVESVGLCSNECSRECTNEI